MQNQSGIALKERTEPMKGDFATMVASRKSPGIVILNGLGGVLHMNEVAWQIWTVIRRHDAVPKKGVMPQTVIDLCKELESSLEGSAAGQPNPRYEATRVMTMGDGVVHLRALALDGIENIPRDGRRFLIMLEHAAERAERSQGNDTGKDRFCLTDREWQVTQALTKGFTNKEIGNALRITEPTVKSHLKHIMQKMKCTTRTAIVSQVVGSMACGSA